MTGTGLADWQWAAITAAAVAAALMLIGRLPVIGRLVRLATSFALLALCVYLLLQQAPYEPSLARIADKLGLDRQAVRGRELRVRLGPGGHFWVRAEVNGHPTRMLVDSGASVTALSARTAMAAGISPDAGVMPVILRTAGGMVRAETATVARLDLGPISATDLKTVIAPGLGITDVLGLNFLSRLQSWRVEGDTLVMVPKG
jgi:aspartyl protease family protein